MRKLKWRSSQQSECLRPQKRLSSQDCSSPSPSLPTPQAGSNVPHDPISGYISRPVRAHIFCDGYCYIPPALLQPGLGPTLSESYLKQILQQLIISLQATHNPQTNTPATFHTGGMASQSLLCSPTDRCPDGWMARSIIVAKRGKHCISRFLLSLTPSIVLCYTSCSQACPFFMGLSICTPLTLWLNCVFSPELSSQRHSTMSAIQQSIIGLGCIPCLPLPRLWSI